MDLQSDCFGFTEAPAHTGATLWSKSQCWEVREGARADVGDRSVCGRLVYSLAEKLLISLSVLCS